MARFKFLLIFFGIGLGFFGWEERQLASLADVTPIPITLSDLGANGPGDNAHVIVGEYFLCTWDYVYVEGRGGDWTEAWVPAVPLGGAFHQRILGMLDEDGNWPEGAELPVPDDRG